MKKTLLALLLTLVLILPVFAKGDTEKKESATTPAPATAVVQTPVQETAPVKTVEKKTTEYSVDFQKNTVNAGSVKTVVGSSEGGEVSYAQYQGIPGKDYTDPAYYTFKDYTAGTSDMKWSTHTWETNEDSAILDYISSGFYSFAVNDTVDGWAVTLEMANEVPEDVTSKYVGKYGIEEGDKAKAWRISLRKDLCWENGAPIKADDFIYSYKELLDPVMKNRRADSLYAGDFQIYNAKNYFYSGQVVKVENAVSNAYEMADLTKGSDGQYVTPDGEKVFLAVDFALTQWLGGETLAAYVDAYGSDYFVTDTWDALLAKADADGLVPLTDENYALYAPVTTGNPAWGETEEDLPNYFVVEQAFPEIDWSEVGILKTGEYELTMITVSETADPNYYVPYNLSSSYLVYEPMWEACKTYYNSNGDKVTKDSNDIASITTNYCTTADTTMSYGPYRLSYFELDKQYTLERNEKWYGYSDGNHVGQYQTDKISVQVIDSHETALLAFLKGEIDSVSLQASEMETYGSSDYVMYMPESYTTKISFNIDPVTTAERGTQVLTNANFRKAYSLAIDVGEFASSLTTGTAGFGLLNTMYVYDPFSGATYRSTDGGKKAIVELYGLTYGEGGDYDDLDEAYDAVTGYDLVEARATMAKAYDECVAAGLYDGTSNIELDMRVYQSDDIYVKMFNFLNEALKSACVGTGFEGKVSLKMTVDADYYNTMYSGATDIIFTTWGGAAYSPYTVLYECYCDASDGSGNQMEFGFDTSKVMVTINVDGVDFTTDLQTWAHWADGDPATVISEKNGSSLLAFNDYDATTKAEFFGKLEYSFLAFFPTKPIYYRNSALLLSQKGQYASKQYLDLVGFGGISFYTYNYDDAAWAAYVSSGNLKY